MNSPCLGVAGRIYYSDMEVNLPNFGNEDKNTLYFIGNGFDLFHGVKSKFIHFYSWLNLKDEVHEQFASDMEDIFTESGVHGNWLWRNFEEALGLLDVDDLHGRFSGKENNEFYDEDYQKRASQHIHTVTSKIPAYLKEWVKFTNESTIHQKLPLSPKSFYLTFNYTLFLEQVYNIPQDHILHIHNSFADEAPLITGHLTDFREKYNDTDSINIERSKQNIIEEANLLRKPVEKLIKENHVFFDLLSNVKNIVIFGHSLSKIDRQYFTEVVSRVQDNAHWYFVFKGETSRAMYEDVIKDYYDEHPYSRKISRENCKYIEIKENV